MGMSGMKRLSSASALKRARKSAKGDKRRKKAANQLRRLRKSPTGRQTAETIRGISLIKR